ncbi:hypothetical protein F2Q69_00024795 [Brassica cretica]|uniref:Peptidase M16 N-terminal domain-containing protein n=1 Tax=Brassica cretica TaxID=69181 RepID=A0A8S9QCE4_BRACR|nr:hypothetical protein F2Q69_00024795 [Brassica cretica]
MSSSNYFRSWIDRPHLDPNTRLLTEEYQRGITEFMGLVHRQPEAKTGTCSSEYSSSEFSEGPVPRNSPMKIPRNISSEFRRIGPSESPSKYPDEVLPCDPPYKMGLVHMIEHMIFNGSTNNPGKTEFRDFVKMNGGEVYADTEMEHPGYSFMIDSAHLKLDDQSMRITLIIHVVSETHAERMPEQLYAKINKSASSNAVVMSVKFGSFDVSSDMQDHPFNRFTWGNNQSFSGQEPLALCDGAMRLFRKHFIGASMNLVIIGSEAVNELEDSVIEYFPSLNMDKRLISYFLSIKILCGSMTFYILLSLWRMHKL